MTVQQLWTDYPIQELGDINGMPAPMRPVEAITEYDPPHEKYVVIRVQGIPLEIKRCYVYEQPVRPF